MSERIGDISNYYGKLWVQERDNKFYWSIDDWDGDSWFEITKELYDALIKYETEREK